MRAILAALALALGSCAVAAAEWDVASLNRTVDQTNFLVNRGCSGTLIDLANRYVLTAAHCVEDQYEVVEREKISDDGVVTKERVRRLHDGTVTQFVFSGGDQVKATAYTVKLAAIDRDRDLALLQVKSDLTNTLAAAISCSDPERGERVYVVGNPSGMLYASVTSGIVSSIQRNYGLLTFGERGVEKQPLMQISAGIVGGNSGGAVFNVHGELVGVPVLGHRINEVIGFAVPLQSVREFLKSNGAASLVDRCEKQKDN